MAEVLELDAARRRRVPFVRGDHVEIAERLLEDLGARGELVHDEGELHQYQAASGLWRVVTDAAQSTAVQAYAGSLIGESKTLKLRAGDVAGAMRLAQDRATRTAFFSEARAGLVFADGFLEVTAEGAKLRPHAPHHRARLGYPFAYAGNVAATKWLGFLHELFRDDPDREEKVVFLAEFFGACLLGVAPQFQRCVVAVGQGENGKSKLSEIVEAAMPTGACAAIPPQDWGHEYRRAMLAGRRFNAVAELPEADIIASEAFKAVIAGDLIVGRHIREAPFQFRPSAGHYFAANRLPGTRDMTDGFWRRIVVVRFGRSFKDDPTRDPHVARSIIAAELPGVVSWMVQGAVRLLRSRAFTLPPSHIAELEAWRRNADPVALFVNECTRALEEGELGHQARDLYAAHRKWAQENGYHAVAANKFGERMALLGRASRKHQDCNRYPVRLLEDSGGLAERFGASAPARSGGASWR